MKKGAKATRNNGLKAKGLRHKRLQQQNFKITKELLSGFKSSGGVPIKARNGTSFTTEREQLERWKEHFNEILNQDESDTLCDLGSDHAREMLNVNLSDMSLEEVRSVLRKVKNNKAAGADDIQPELLMYGGKTLEMELLHLFNRIWKQERIPYGCYSKERRCK